MTSIKLTASSNSFLDPLPINIVESMRSIVKDSFERLALLKEDPKRALLGGIWYVSDYIRSYRALQLSETEKSDYPPAKSLEKIVWGYAPETHFNRIKELVSGKESPLRFISKPDVSASDALDAALKGPLLIDCGAACQLAMHQALRVTCGKEWYDAQFKEKLVIGIVPGQDPLGRFLKQVVSISKNGKKVFQISSGMMTAYRNHPSYIQKHRFGSYACFNLIYAGKSKYLGLGLKPEGVTADELRSLFVAEFNKPPSLTLGGLVSTQEYNNGLLGLDLSGIPPIHEDMQIKLEEVPGFDHEGSITCSLEKIEQSIVPSVIIDKTHRQERKE